MSNIGNQSMQPLRVTNLSGVADGRVPVPIGYGVTAAGQTPQQITGSPIVPWTELQLPGLTAADSDYFVASFASGTGVTTQTVKLGTILNSGKLPQLTDTNGKKFIPARNLVITSSGSKSCVFTISFIDDQYRYRTKVLTISLTTAGYATNFTMVQLLSISLAASASTVDITYGYGNRIGLPHPLYSFVGNKALYNAAGTAYPNTPMALGGTSTGGATEVQVIPITDWYNSNGVTPSGTASATELGLVTGVAGTATPSLQSEDANGTTVSPKARYPQYMLPANYIPGSAITIRANAGLITNATLGTSTVDFSVYKNGAGSDLVTTAATAITTTAGNKDFVITPTGLAPGDWLDILLTVTITDAGGTGTAKIGRVNAVSVLPTVEASTVSSYTDWRAGVPSASSTTDEDPNGTVRLGSTDLSTGTDAPDGTADYALWWVNSDPQGVVENGASVYRFE